MYCKIIRIKFFAQQTVNDHAKQLKKFNLLSSKTLIFKVKIMRNKFSSDLNSAICLKTNGF